MMNQTRRKSLREAGIEVVAPSGAAPHQASMSERLEQVMRHHVEAEEESLEPYRQLEEASGDPVVRMLKQGKE